jgi:hypothetical protein
MKLGPVIFQNTSQGRGNGVTAARPIDQVMNTNVVPFFHTIGTILSSMTTLAFIL